MSKDNINPVAFDEIDCTLQNDAVCPYCNHAHVVETEDYTQPDTPDIYQCDNCEKYFTYETN